LLSKPPKFSPHIIYEIWNEPNGVNWTTVKAYAEEVIDVIRQNDPSNIIVVGTPTWSQRVDQAADNPINKTNIAYALHYYAATHKQSLRDKALYAINKGMTSAFSILLSLKTKHWT
jgi:endoglucanase